MSMNDASRTSRRAFLGLGLRAGVAVALAGALPGVTFAATGSGDRRFVVVILRGALDGLSLVPPHGDPDYANVRGAIALAKPGATDGALPLDATFGLHPALTGVHALYAQRELLPIHAVATGYRERSHFDGQNVLENGGEKPSGTASGWLNRALVARGVGRAGANGRGTDSGSQGLAIGQNVPLILRGDAPVGSWAPSALPDVEPELITRLRDLYSNDAVLSARLDEAAKLGALAAEDGAGGMESGKAMLRGGNVERLKAVADAAGRMLAANDGPRIAVMDAGGWDTHANEGGANGQLANRLRGLDAALLALKGGLGDAWSKSVVLVCTEFGRTVAINGTRGTDHGTGAAALLLGGAVNGGRMLADWPGLTERARYEGRDLRPTLDLRAVAKGVLRDHLALTASGLDAVFPGTGRVAPTRDLIRA
jgi:uncharacterized protein (DUF1501 family)